ncbi:MAG: DUF4215 domain-containing protein, partial [Myxococcota bacterium]
MNRWTPWLSLVLCACALDVNSNGSEPVAASRAELVEQARQYCPTGNYCWYLPPPTTADAHSNPSTYRLAFSVATGTATGTYSINGGAPQNFTVSAGTAEERAIPIGDLAISAINQAERKGIFVVSDQVISVSLYRPGSNSRDSVAAKEQTFSLGQRFRLGGHSRNGGGNASRDEGTDTLIVYAPFGANVTIEAPPGAAPTFWQGQTTSTFTVTLAPGEAYTARTQQNLCGAEMDGTLVTSTEDITVVTGGRGFSGGCTIGGATTAGSCGDAGFDMTVPVGFWGTRHIVRAGGSNASSGEAVRVVADVDGTEVFLNDDATAVATLAAGEYFEFRPGVGGITSPTLIDTSEAVAVYHNAAVGGCELGMSFIPPLYFPNVTSSVSLVASDRNTNRVVVAIESTGEASLRLNGNPLSGATSEAVPGTTLRYVSFDVAANAAHVVSADEDFQLGLISGPNTTGLFGYFSPYRRPGCGDGIVDVGEACDDGNIDNFDGCDAACEVEDGFLCTGEPSACLINALNCQVLGTPGVLAFGDADNAEGGILAAARSGSETLTNLFGANEIDAVVSVAAATTGSDVSMVPGADNVVSIDFRDSGIGIRVPVEGLRLLFNDFDPGELVTAIRATRADGRVVTLDLEDTAVLSGDLAFAGGLTSSAAGGSVVLDLSAYLVAAIQIEFGAAAPNLRFVGANQIVPCVGRCGDGRLQTGEGCDDGNVRNDDGCTSECLVEDGALCNAFFPGAIGSASCVGVCNTLGGSPGVCQSSGGCGNGVLEGAERCDDGNVIAGDGCNAQCLLEVGETCVAGEDCASGICSGGATCEAAGVCGDSTVDAGEGCDDGNADEVSCTSACLIPTGLPCGATGSSSCVSGLCAENGPNMGDCVDPGCGNGFIEAGEGCDEGTDNGNGTSLCSATCLIENGGTCGSTPGALVASASCASGLCYTNAGLPGSCIAAVPNATAACGNGILESGEACDDGSGPDGAGTGSADCDLNCLIPTGAAPCNFANPGLQGNQSCAAGVCNRAAAIPTCSEPNVCGNGVLESANGEACDDGGSADGDGCSATCLLELGETCPEAGCV